MLDRAEQQRVDRAVQEEQNYEQRGDRRRFRSRAAQQEREQPPERERPGEEQQGRSDDDAQGKLIAVAAVEEKRGIEREQQRVERKRLFHTTSRLLRIRNR